ncbi:MAG: malonate transporter [Cocleimonas sp.]|jgi:malonate transporter
MNIFLESLSFSLTVTAPIFIVLLVGIYLKRINFINDSFIDISSKLVFNISLPLLLFFSIQKTPLEEITNFSLIIYGAVATTVAFILLELWAKRLEPPEDRGVFVQGSFRANMGFIGLAYCLNAYGEEGLIAASLYLGLITALYNVLSVITLNRSSGEDQGILKIIKGIAKNPLIIAIAAGLIVSALHIPMPEFAAKTGQYFANLALPLALLCTGGALNFQELKTNPNKTFYASISKLVIVPLAITAGGILFDFRGIDLGILFLMCSAPTATASFIMVKGIGGNYKLAANIIALTSLGSIASVSLGIMLLRGFGFM